MKNLTRSTAVLGAAGLIAAGLATAPAANAAGNIFQIKVTEVQTDYEDDFSGTPEAGDSFEWTSNLRQNGDRVGKDRGECKFVRIVEDDDDDPIEAVLRCTVRYQFFDTGTIRASGKVRIDWDDLEDQDFDVKLPVRDGTGDFDDAGGTVRNQQINDSKARLTFRLTGVR